MFHPLMVCHLGWEIIAVKSQGQGASWWQHLACQAHGRWQPKLCPRGCALAAVATWLCGARPHLHANGREAAVWLLHSGQRVPQCARCMAA